FPPAIHVIAAEIKRAGESRSVIGFMLIRRRKHDLHAVPLQCRPSLHLYGAGESQNPGVERDRAREVVGPQSRSETGQFHSDCRDRTSGPSESRWLRCRPSYRFSESRYQRSVRGVHKVFRHANPWPRTHRRQWRSARARELSATQAPPVLRWHWATSRWRE